MATVYPPNFELLASDASWRSSWTHIIPGRFTSSPYTGLLFYEQSTGYAEIYETDGSGHIVAPALQMIDSLGSYSAWTHIVPGFFGESGLTGVVLYDQASGFARILECSEGGVLTQLSEYTDWRTTWSHIVPGFFTSSNRTSLLFYSPAEGYGELWETDALGLSGDAPVQTYGGWRSDWTHIVAGDFFWTPGYASATVFSDLCFYEASTGYAEMYAFDANGLVPYPTAKGQLLIGASQVVAGNLGGYGMTDLLLHDRSGGRAMIYSFGSVEPAPPYPEPRALFVEKELLSGLRTSVDLVIAGHFQFANVEDLCFSTGPSGVIYSFGDDDRMWRAGAGAFVDLLFYDRDAGLGETYRHDPPQPPAPPLYAYVSTGQSHVAAGWRETGSVLPGETIAFHVSSESPYSITLFQQGYFGAGVFERQVAQLDNLPATGALPIHRLAYKEGAQWPVSVSIPLTDYLPGFYRIQVQDVAGNAIEDLYLVVRAPSPSRSRILLIIADTTYAAYNEWGGRNAYTYVTTADITGSDQAYTASYPQSAARAPYAFQVSFHRPKAYSFGNGSENQEAPFIRWLMKSGVPVDVCTARDLHFNPPSLDDYTLLLFAGHHEYWTWEMRDHVEYFVQSGGGAAFLGANTSWWQVRISPNGLKQWCYKVKGFDPVVSSSPERTTINWWGDPVGRPETNMTGASYSGTPIGLAPGRPFEVTNPAHWVFEGTGLGLGAGFGLFNCTAAGCDSAVGGETEILQNGAVPGMVSPPGYALARAYETDVAAPDSPRVEMATMGSFQLGAGEVINAATISWANGLAFDNEPLNKVPQITMNIINRLGPTFKAVPGAGYDVGVGANASVWVIGTDSRPGGGYGIYQWDGTIWIPAPGAAVRIAVDPGGSPWAVTADSAILRMVSGEWEEMPGRAHDIGVGAEGSVWAIGAGPFHHGGGFGIYRWNGVSWDAVAGAGVRIAVGADGNAWVVNAAGSLYEYSGGSWLQREAPAALDVGVGPDGSVWVTGKDQGIYRWNGVDDWRPVDGAAVAISVGPGGNPWVINDNQEIYYWG
jgi:hypothetical protein